jgi:hypothetical protein
MRSRSYKNVLALLHITRTAFLVRLATPRPPNRNAHTVKGSLGKVIMALPQPFRFLGIVWYGFLHC